MTPFRGPACSEALTLLINLLKVFSPSHYYTTPTTFAAPTQPDGGYQLPISCFMDKVTRVIQKLYLTNHDKHASPRMEYPPPFSDSQLENLVSEIKDWQITHGSLLKLVNTDQDSTVLTRPVGTCLFPTLFPRERFEQALGLQKTYNKLYARVAEDEEWLYDTLKDDEFARILWGIHEEVKKEGYVQDHTLGIFRSDYMLDANPAGQVKLKQVEFNTISCAGGIHSNLISDMHRHLQRRGAHLPADPNATIPSLNISASHLPPSHTLSTITSGLVSAHTSYGPPKSPAAEQTCILIIVQPRNFNIADERPIEYALWDHNIPTFRVELLSPGVLAQTSLALTRELLYHPPSHPAAAGPLEVSVVYLRAGFEAEEYSGPGGGEAREARVRIELSRAVKCPSILSHLTTFKKVQQALAVPGVLQRFLSSAAEVAGIASTFARLYPMDTSAAGLEARKLARDGEAAEGYVLKPSLEGGGHNIYGSSIPAFLARTPEEKWSRYILMSKIVSPTVRNLLMSAQGLYNGPVISELGVFGVCLWRRSGETEGRVEMVEDQEPCCWSFKTKGAGVDEMSVVKGYGCFDSPALVDDDVFMACCRDAEKS
ncbi:Glutathione synthetase large chain [Lachnellula arida]|uniref:Glutathione synthetase n=1 Tax=Lachnellula arida TaxID=1316785 RepID=A0A8T9B2X4_9HELO|nr:Glutathione synthetase large chain [Lachnellula arida]